MKKTLVKIIGVIFSVFLFIGCTCSPCGGSGRQGSVGVGSILSCRSCRGSGINWGNTTILFFTVTVSAGIAHHILSKRVNKKCPFCANEIKKEVAMCQFCNKELPKA